MGVIRDSFKALVDLADWHGRAAPVALLIIALGGGGLIAKAASTWAAVGGVYSWIVGAMAFAILLLLGTRAGHKLGPPRHGIAAAQEPPPTPGLAPMLPPLNINLSNIGNASQTQASHAAAPPAPAPVQEAPRKQLEFVSDKVTLIRAEQCVLVTDDMRSPNGLVAIFQNKIRAGELNTPAVYRAAARLTFKNSHGEETHINHGTWDGEVTHYQQFKAGEKHRLLIYARTISSGVSWRSYYEKNPFRGYPPNTVYSPHEEWLVDDWDELEIALLEGDAVVFCGTFKCEPDAQGFMRLRQQ